jgi:hypothetical protein
VDTHFGYTDTAYYQQPLTILGAIEKLHIRHIRDGLSFSWIAPNLYSIYAQLAQAGIGADLIMPNPGGTGNNAQGIEALLVHYPSVDAIEAPNEYDQAGGASWAADLRSYLPTVQQVGQTAGLNVFGPSLTQTDSYPALGDVASSMNYANLHAYWGGRNPETGGWGPPDAQNNYYGSIPYDFDQLNIDSPGKPVVMTETGYVVNNTPSQNVIPESVEAIYEPRLLLHAWNMGIRRTYIYELMDDPSSPAGFGLLRTDLSPRPAYTAIASLMGLLSDGPGAFSPQVLNYWVDGAGAKIETTVLQKQDGSFWLALWEPALIFEVNAVTPLTVAPQTVTLSVAGGMEIEKIWSFDDAGNTSVVSPGSASASVSVSPAVTLVEIAKP